MLSIRRLAAACAVLLSNRDVGAETLAAANATVANASNQATKVIGATSAVGSVVFNHQTMSLIIGAIGVFGGLMITWIFKRRELAIKREFLEREDRREQEAHELNMASRRED